MYIITYVVYICIHTGIITYIALSCIYVYMHTQILHYIYLYTHINININILKYKYTNTNTRCTTSIAVLHMQGVAWCVRERGMNAIERTKANDRVERGTNEECLHMHAMHHLHRNAARAGGSGTRMTDMPSNAFPAENALR